MSFSDATEPMDIQIAIQETTDEGYTYSLETETFSQQVRYFYHL